MFFFIPNLGQIYFFPPEIFEKNGSNRFKKVFFVAKSWCDIFVLKLSSIQKQISSQKYILLLYVVLVYYKSLSDSNGRENDYNWACFYLNTILFVGWVGTNIVLNNKYDQFNYYLFYVIIAIWEWIVQFFSSYLHDKLCIFASILLITYKRILYVNKLTYKDNVFMSMTWKFSNPLE